MSERLVRGETAVEFFREQLERAMDHQKVSTSTFTQFYLVNLLAGCLRGELPPTEPGFDETPLALLYVRAIQSSRRDRAKLLRGRHDFTAFTAFTSFTALATVTFHILFREFGPLEAQGGRATA